MRGAWNAQQEPGLALSLPVGLGKSINLARLLALPLHGNEDAPQGLEVPQGNQLGNEIH